MSDENGSLLEARAVHRWAIVLPDTLGREPRSLIEVWLPELHSALAAERLVVVTDDAETLGLARTYAAEQPGVDVVGLPSDKGTAPATLVGLARLLGKGPLSAGAVVISSTAGTSAMFGTVSSFWRIAAEHLPWLAALFMGYAKAVGSAREDGLLEAIYQGIKPCDFAESIGADQNERRVPADLPRDHRSTWALRRGRLTSSFVVPPVSRAVH